MILKVSSKLNVLNSISINSDWGDLPGQGQLPWSFRVLGNSLGICHSQRHPSFLLSFMRVFLKNPKSAMLALLRLGVAER